MSLCTPSAVRIPGGPTDIVEDAELQADWIPRQVTSHGAAEYVSYPNGWAIVYKKAKVGLSFDSADISPMAQQCRKSWI